jgi:hypothetical protein
MSRRRRDIDNRPGLLAGDQPLSDATAAQECSGENDIDRTVPILEIDGEEPAQPAKVECIVYQQIDDAERRLRSFDHAVDGIGVGDIPGNSDGFAACSLNVVYKSVKPVSIQVIAGDGSTAARKRSSNLLSDIWSRTGDNRNASC